MNRVGKLRAAILVGTTLLAACGGGGSEGGVASTPPPPVTYTKIADMTGNRTFQTGGVTYTSTPSGLSDGTTQNYGNGVTLAYNAAADSYTVTAPTGPTVVFLFGATPTVTNVSGMTQTFGPADQAPSLLLSNSVTYVKTNGDTRDQLTLIAPGGSVPLSYTVLGVWSTIALSAESGTFRVAVGGAPTLASDMPKTGTANYTIGVGGNAILTQTPGISGTVSVPVTVLSNSTFSGSVTNADAIAYPPGGGPVTTVYSLAGNSSGTFSANFATGAITTTLVLAGTALGQSGVPTSFGTFNGAGTLTSGGPGYTGTLTGVQAPSSGSFSGAFFGPQAVETAFAYFLSGPNFSAAGGVGGVKQ